MVPLLLLPPLPVGAQVDSEASEIPVINAPGEQEEAAAESEGEALEERLRVQEPSGEGEDGQPGTQTSGEAGGPDVSSRGAELGSGEESPVQQQRETGPSADLAETPAAPEETEMPTDLPPPSPQYETVVTAHRHDRRVFETAVGVNVVDDEELSREIPGTPAEALRDQPGIWVQQTGHIGGAPIIRGLMGNQILLMVDGVRLNNVGLFAGPNSFLQTIDIEDVASIEVVRGPGSVMYGTDALGGMVNVITRPPASWPDEGWEFGGLAKAVFGSADTQRRLRTEAFVASPEFRLRVGGTFEGVDDLRGGGDIGLQHPSGWDEMDFDVRLDYRPATDHELELAFWQLGQYDIERFDTYLRSSASLTDRHRRLVILRYDTRHPFPGLSRLTVLGYFHDQGQEERGLSGDSTESTQYWTPGVDLQAESPVASWLLLNYGFHYHHDWGTSEINDDGTVTRGFPDVTWDNTGLFLEAEVEPWEQLLLTAAGRWDYYLLRTDPDEASVPEGLTVEDMRLDTGTHAFAGSFSAVGRLTDWLNAVASVGNGFRAPNVSDTVSTGQFTYGYAVPSPGVGPETSLTTEAGVRVDHLYVGAAASFFYTRIWDLIDSRPGTFNGRDWVDVDGDGIRGDGEDVYVKSNVGDAHALGVEASIELRLPPQWTLFGSFTWITGRNDTADEPLDRAFPMNGSVGLRWQDSSQQRFWAELWVRLVAEFPASEIPEDRRMRDPAFRVNPQDAAFGLLGGDGTVPAYWLLGARAGARINDYMDVRLSVSNILDVEYRDKDSRIDGPGINVLATLVLHYPGAAE